MTIKTRKFLAVTAAVVMALSLIVLAACADKHQHTFSDAWEKDETYHWHAATCEHTDQVSDKAAHDFDANGKCTVCDYQKSTPDQHTHTYTKSWWSDETNHWHAATCEHADLKSDTAAHVYNGYGRCTVCNYQGEVPYNTSLTATQFATAMRNVASATSFTYKEEAAGKLLLETFVAGNVASTKDGTADYHVYEKADDEREMSLELQDGFASITRSCGSMESAKRDFASTMTALPQEITFDMLSYDAQKGCYVCVVDDIEVQLRFVEDKLYSLSLEGGPQGAKQVVTYTDINNTVAEFILDHEHDFTTYYKTSSMYHWNAVRCQAHQDEIVEKQPHAFGADGKCTVCGYQKPTEVNRQVTEEQWREAFKMKGIINVTMHFNEEYASSYDAEISLITKEGIYMPGADNDYVQLVDGKTYYYYTDYSGNYIKEEDDDVFHYWSALLEIYSIGAVYGTVDDSFDQFQYDAATGRYVGSGSLWKGYNFEGLAYVTFNDGELESIDFEDSYAYLMTFGDAHVDFPDGASHQHDFVVRQKVDYSHTLVCSTCGREKEEPHAFVSGVCSVCGIKEMGDSHQHDWANVSYEKMYHDSNNNNWQEYHYVVCRICGVQINRERHQFEDGVCTLCGEKQSTSGGGSTTPGGETDPGTGGETDPGTGGETDPGTGGGSTDPGTGGETDPGTGGGSTEPGTGGGTEPGTGGGTEPGTGGGSTTPGGGSEQEPDGHTYTKSWWSDETNHWHAATCEHTDLRSDEAAHVYNTYGRCTVCNYQGEVPYNTTLTAEQFAAAMRDAANVTSFTIIEVSSGRVISETYVNGNVAYIKDGTRDYRIYQKADGEFEISVDIEEGLAGATSGCRAMREARETIDSLMTVIPQAITFDMLSYSAEKGCYVCYPDEQGTEVQFKFVGSKLYSLSMQGFTYTDLNNTVVEFILDHEHDLTTYYKTSSMYHWYVVRCQNHLDEIVEKEAHTFGSNNKCTVCGYEKPAEVNRQVTEEQWREAFELKGIINLNVHFNEEYAHSYAEFAMITKEGIYLPNSDYEYMQLADGKVYQYAKDYWGNYVKIENDDFITYWGTFLELHSMGSQNGVLGELFDKFRYDEATGRYVGDASLCEGYHFEGLVYVTFNDGELESIEFEDSNGYTVTFGNAHIDFPDLPLHEHTFVVKNNGNDDHTLVCSVCGLQKNEDHAFVSGVCTVCGVKEVGESHQHDWDNVSYEKFYHDPDGDYWMEYHYVVCRICGAYLEQQEHVFVNGTCTLCGEKQHTHTFVLDETRTDEMYHTVTCSDPECRYTEQHGSHRYNEDANVCDVCGQARHWHECDDWELSETDHHGKCKICGYTVREDHVYVNGFCRVCGVAKHTHTWQNPTPFDSSSSFYWTEHLVYCSKCTLYQWREHDFSEGDVCACGVHRHVHTATDDWERTVYIHKGTCPVCGQQVEQGHSYVGGTCEVCGVKEHGHTWGGTPTQLPNQKGNPEYWTYHSVVCTDCGATGLVEHDYTNGDVCACGLPKHEHEAQWVGDSNYHRGSCSVCFQYVSEEHTYDENGFCTACGVQNHEHTWGKYTQFPVDPFDRQYLNYHQRACTQCPAVEIQPHDYDDNDDCACGFHKHTHMVKWEELSPTHHAGKCGECGEYVSENHVYDENYDCTICGYHHEHNYYLDPYGTADEHTVRCHDCDYTQLQEHTYDEGSDVCNQCGHKKGDKFE